MNINTNRALDFTIREATTLDIDEILGHRLAMFAAMGFDAEPALTQAVKNSRPFIEQGLKEGWYRGWIALDAGRRPIGGGGIVVTDWTAHPSHPHQNRRPYILNFYTDPEYRRASVARTIMQAILDWAKSQGFGCVWLHASDAGRPLYENLGFTATNEMKLEIT